jgi:uncharacterized protein
MSSTADREGLIVRAGAFVRRHMQGDPGHDWSHVERTVALGRRIAAAEAADVFIVELALTFHDVADTKFTTDENAAERLTRQFLEGEGVAAGIIETVCTINRSISFHDGREAVSPEAKCAQDADRLEAMGAIGIARAFSYAGHKGNPLGDPRAPEPASAVAHFYDKLLRLKDQMQTETGRHLAAERHRVLEAYLAQLDREWRGQA